MLHPRRQIEVLVPRSASLGLQMMKEERLDTVLDDNEPADTYEDSESEVGDPDSISTLPIRTLNMFTFFTEGPKEMQQMGELMMMDFEFSNYRGKLWASGTVEAGPLDLEDDLEDTADGQDSVWAVVGPIKQCWLHFDGEALDPRIWVQTPRAWYILLAPAPDYLPFCTEFLRNHCLFHLMLSTAYNHPDLELHDFWGKLDEGINLRRIPALPEGRLLSPEDVNEGFEMYIYHQVLLLTETHSLRGLCKHPLIMKIYASSMFDEFRKPDGTLRVHKDTNTNVRRKGSGARTKRSKSTTQNVILTPVVNRVASGWLRIPTAVHGEAEHDFMENLDEAHEIVQAHHNNPDSIQWGELSADTGTYSSVTIDGQKYKPGDCVMVLKEDSFEHMKSVKNELANDYWFCYVVSLFEGPRGEKKFCSRWLLHGSQTILKEISDAQSLYLTDLCDDVELEAVVQKITVDFNFSNNQRTREGAIPTQAPAANSTEFFCSYAYDHSRMKFTSLPKSIGEVTEEAVTLERGVLCIGDLEYHQHDFILLHDSKLELGDGTPDLLAVAQIRGLPDMIPEDPLEAVLDIEVFPRKMSTEDGEYQALDHELRHDINRPDVRKVSLHDVRGKCAVAVFPSMAKVEENFAWVCHPTHFYFTSSEKDGVLVRCEIRTCGECDALEKTRWEERWEGKKDREGDRIRVLELYAGCGGLGTGLELTGLFDVKWAVEWDESAAKTYMNMHPKTLVYCCDVVGPLAAAMEDRPPKVHSKLDGSLYTIFPKPGEVDCICGGPPCQGFSNANPHPQPDDVRCSHPLKLLSYVEFFKPKYFIIENVAGLLDFPLMGMLGANGRVEGGLALGFVKLIYQTALALGYQIQLRILNAASFGVPQARNRLFFIGTRRDVPTLDFPLPTHAFPRQRKHVLRGITYNGEPKRVPTASWNPDEPDDDLELSGPLLPVTANDALSDLPRFDWINPHVVRAKTAADEELVRKRTAKGIRQMVATDGSRTVGWELTGYRTNARNAFQYFVRRKMKDAQVTDHQTVSYASTLPVEITTTLLLKPKRCHRDPEVAGMMDAKKLASKSTYYGRLDGKKQFRTVLTGSRPYSRGAVLLHPSQRRSFTVREMARAQGFPDDYVFETHGPKSRNGRLNSKLKQIGNAVPPPLALAIGRAFTDSWEQVLANEREKHGRDGSPDLL
ncbi:S-adenosyl-L-methionine-dependent methyltransferase [Cylindrobasidium torrendii FP15055 ss-10]|uniref:Cytosine-specific methyltransferase n=1 Tax=Cylindrobasidium torrendii FP15055 ss-10 TaxID=1314674 RepID=A0A0D7BSS8_9AGAR|nr:S-adenosyl-L-methionine-dependent methyltransferase [Cylindrobasidium torrendii FP15055 ss-10]